MLTYNPSAEEAKPRECLWLSGRQYDLIIELQTMRDHCLKEYCFFEYDNKGGPLASTHTSTQTHKHT